MLGKVRYLGENGHEWQRVEADSILEVGALYTLRRSDVHSSHTTIELKEFPGKKFNSVMFAPYRLDDDLYYIQTAGFCGNC